MASVDVIINGCGLGIGTHCRHMLQSEIESQGIFKNVTSYIGVIRKLAVHIYYCYLLIYNYFNQGCYRVTGTDPIYPVACDPLGLDPITQK